MTSHSRVYLTLASLLGASPLLGSGQNQQRSLFCKVKKPLFHFVLRILSKGTLLRAVLSDQLFDRNKSRMILGTRSCPGIEVHTRKPGCVWVDAPSVGAGQGSESRSGQLLLGFPAGIERLNILVHVTGSFSSAHGSY